MKFSAPSVALAAVALTTAADAYTTCGGYTCRPPNAAAFGPIGRMSPRQRAEFRRQSEFVDRAFQAMANDLQKSKVDTTTDPNNYIPKQKEFVDKAVEFFTDMGSINRQDADSLREITNRGFEIVQDLATGAYSPAYEVQDKESDIEISLDVPGVVRGDIDILFEDGVLKVSGTRKMKNSNAKPPQDEDGEETTTTPSERSVPFSRSFPVDVKTCDTDAITAGLDYGVLTIRIPKREVEKPVSKRIDIL